MLYATALIFVLNLFKFFGLGGGVILGEPDEMMYAEIVTNFSKSFWPYFSAGPYYFSIPLYPWLVYLTSLVFPGWFSPLRIVSCLFSLILALAIFFYVRWKVSGWTGFVAALFWTLCPFAVYYSRVGVIEMTVTVVSFLFLFSFDYALATRRKKWALLSGLFLGLAVCAKYTALIFVVAASIYFVLLSVRRTFKGVKNPSNLKTIRLDIIPTLSLFVAAVMFFPIAFVFYRHDPYLFKVHTLVNLISWEKYTGARIWVGDSYLPPLIWPFLERMGWWLSWPIVVFASIGIAALVMNVNFQPKAGPPLAEKIKNWEGNIFLITSIVACFLVLRRLPLYPRYFLPLVPFIVIFAGIGFGMVVRLITRHPEFISGSLHSGHDRFRNKFGMTKGILLLILTILILPTSITAYRATRHNLVEEASQYIKSRSQTENPWIFSNYWPHFFGLTVKTDRATWLAESKDEIQAFVPDEERTASEILKEEGGFVVLEELYSRLIISPNKYREQARQWLLENYEPVETITDPSPNFPHSREKENKIEIFVLK